MGTFGKKIPTELKQVLRGIKGIKEERINDTLTVFTVGAYEDYADAEKQKQDLIKKGVSEAFGVKSTYVNQIAVDLDQIQKGSYTFDNLAFKVEFEEYRIAIPFENIQNIISQYGMEMRESEGGLKTYSIGTFKKHSDALNLQKQLLGKAINKPEVVAYFKGEMISIEEALKLSKGK